MPDRFNADDSLCCHSNQEAYRMMMKYLLLLSLGAFCASVGAQTSAPLPGLGQITLPIWPNGAPGAKPNPTVETAIPTGKDGLIAGRPIVIDAHVSTPTLTLFAPKKQNSGAAVVVFPGGGYHILAIDLEGTEVCEWLNAEGINCVLLKYRVPDSGPYPKSREALQDAQRAVGLVRLHAQQWHIDPNRIGVLGFSAGGHLAASLSTHFDKRLYDPVDAADKLSCRPDFAVLVYPAYLTIEEKNFALDEEIHPTASTPPFFLVQAEDDPVHVENALAYFLALKNAKVPAELHIYAEGGHGYGLRRTALPVTQWPRSVETWLRTIKVLPAKRECSVCSRKPALSGMPG
jgi:acetyl esterase/lipase